MKKIGLFLIAAIAGFCTNAQPGYITNIAGNGMPGFYGDGSQATNAQLDWNSCIWIDYNGNLFIADQQNNRVRKVTPSGIISTVAGGGSSSGLGDGGPATDGRLDYVQGVCVDNIGNIYIADQHNNLIRKVDTSGILTTFAGGGSSLANGVPATTAYVNQPAAVTVDDLGNVYICDQNNALIRKVNSSGIITTVAGGGSTLGDGGPATNARLSWPCNLALDHVGNLYIGDFQDSRVRKVSPDGIISTFAGNGTSGFSGDGGPATAAQICSHWGGVFADDFGNVYISDCYNNRIRKVDPTGTINTIAGNGIAGNTGNGGPATAAELSEPVFCFAVPNGDLFISDPANYCVRKMNNAPSYIADSFKVYVANSCTGVNITVKPNSNIGVMNIITYFGDGSKELDTVNNLGLAMTTHNYMMNGTYTIKQVLIRLGIRIDSIQFSCSHMLCNTIQVHYYFDENADCIYDSPDQPNMSPLLVEVDSNSVPIDTISTTSGLYYLASGNPGDIYAFNLLSAPVGYSSCLMSGIIRDTLSLSNINKTRSVGFTCSATTDFDLAIHLTYHWTDQTDQRITCHVTNSTCLPENATLTMDVNPKYTHIVQIYPSPTTIVGNTLTWNLPAIWNENMTGDIQLLPYTYTMMHIGDTIQTHLWVTPVIGDIDTNNNDMVIVDTILAGYDPNEMFVSPTCIKSDSIATQLQYTINFENTGNDTAFNIYILDTLPSNLDPTSLRIVMSTNQMNISKFKTTTGQTVFKFDFPGINLLDSSHHGLCDGGIIFTINTLPGLSKGSLILNRAGIYFDANPVVLTNTVEDNIGCWPAGVNIVNKHDEHILFPNPATNQLTIKTDAFSSFTISNTIGKFIIAQNITGTVTTVNVQSLPAGVYYITFKGEGGSVVDKFVKE